MINNSPRSVLAASSATSNRATAHCISPSCTASPAPTKRPHHWPSAKANQRHSTSISITLASTSATLPRPPRMPSPLGCSTDPADWTRSCWPRPGSLAELNRRARDHRRGNVQVGVEVRLADGNQASVGDVIITRSNDRRLRPTATDWVKNGDRWTITRIGRRGDVTVRHTRSQLTVRLPIDYVRPSTGLGYADRKSVV